MPHQDRILLERDDHGVQLVTLNRPERRNAFDETQFDALSEVLSDANQDTNVAVVVLTGAGGNFSSGLDISALRNNDRRPRRDGKPNAFAACVETVLSFEKPLLAAVPGLAVGGGCTIPIAADVVYVGESLRMRLPFASLGLVPEFASSYLLSASIGRQRANELMFSAEWIDAGRAAEVGIAAGVVPDAELLRTTLEKAREIAQWPTSALVGIKRAMSAGHAAAIAATRVVEDRELKNLIGSPENIEAVTAFVEKREPDFRQFRG